MRMRLFHKRAVAAVGVAIVLVGAAATVGAADGVSDVTANIDGVFAPLQTADGTPAAKFDVCHKPSDGPDKGHTISVGEGALDEHLSHGDSEGACAESGSLAPPDAVGPADKVDVCHKPSDDPNKSHTISIGEAALAAHLARGESEGACAESGSLAPPEGAGSSKVDVCHNPSDDPDRGHTISVGEGALAEHLAHGDSEDACAEAASGG